MEAGKLDDYVIHKRLAPALFGDVLLCAHKPSGGRLVAVKRVQLAAARAQRTLAAGKAVREDVALERALGRRFRQAGGHAHVLELREDIEFDGYLYLVTDYCARGELYEIVSGGGGSDADGQEDGTLPVATTRKYVRQIARGVRFVHAQGFAHRDLSLENVLVTEADECKVCDFGLACAADEGKRAHETVGKLFYMAPEVVAPAAAGYDARQADVWSLGVMLFIMLVGAPPVERAAPADARFRLIAAEGVRALVDRWELTDALPADALDLLAGMLEVDPTRRSGIDQVLAHPFLQEDEVQESVKSVEAEAETEVEAEEEEEEAAVETDPTEEEEHEKDHEDKEEDMLSATLDSVSSATTVATMRHYLSHYKARCQRDYRGEGGDSAARKMDLAAEKDLQRRLLAHGRRQRGSFLALSISRTHFRMSRTRLFFARLGRLLFRRGPTPTSLRLADGDDGADGRSRARDAGRAGSMITVDTRAGRVELGRLAQAA